MKCLKCQHENPSGARFCNGCGQRMDLSCPKCGKTNPPGSRFCNGCGHNLTLPSRTQSLADPGTTYITEETFRLSEGLFRFEALGEKWIKGKEKPVRIFRVIAPSTLRTRFDVSAERGLTPLVGRSRELELLLEGFETVKAGKGQVRE